MLTQNEWKALREVEQRLGEKFPSVSPDLVHALVTSTHQVITGPIREFVPLLVERQARDQLATLCH